jgi:hypothetical protein
LVQIELIGKQIGKHGVHAQLGRGAPGKLRTACRPLPTSLQGQRVTMSVRPLEHVGSTANAEAEVGDRLQLKPVLPSAATIRIPNA